MKPRLPFTRKAEWRFRWLVTESWEVLHRVVAGTKSEGGPNCGVGAADATTACGLRRPFLAMPGVLSRMGRPRCKRCCRAVGVPQGNGAPFNQGINA